MRTVNVDVVRDDVHYLQTSLVAAPGEFANFMQELEALNKRFANRTPGGNRIRRTVSIVTVPEKPTKSN